jgi:aryl-alcohol dehydrogenase-like predicted oxidoreductase
MHKSRIGKTQILVTQVGFGAWAIGSSGYGPVQHEEATAALDEYLEQGGNFIDTARVYGNSEEILGAFLQSRSEGKNVVLASKSPGCDEKTLRDDVETSLKYLRRDAVDLYYLHNPPEEAGRIDQALEAMEKLKAEGKIRAIGASIKGPDVTDKTVELSGRYIQTGSVDALQLIYSIFRQKNAETFDLARSRQVGIIARTNLESGFLTGKYTPGTTFDDHRRRWSKQRLEKIFSEVQSLEQMEMPQGFEGLTQLALAFAMAPAEVTSIIPGAKNRSQARSNTAVASLPALPESLLDQLREQFAGRGEEFNTTE